MTGWAKACRGDVLVELPLSSVAAADRSPVVGDLGGEGGRAKMGLV